MQQSMRTHTPIGCVDCACCVVLSVLIRWLVWLLTQLGSLMCSWFYPSLAYKDEHCTGLAFVRFHKGYLCLLLKSKAVPIFISAFLSTPSANACGRGFKPKLRSQHRLLPLLYPTCGWGRETNRNRCLWLAKLFGLWIIIAKRYSINQ